MNFLEEELARLDEVDLRRSLRRHNDEPGRFISIEGQPVLNLSSNNYLGLAADSRLIEAASQGLRSGGSTASRLVTGNLAAHEELESALASFHGLPAARLFNSGYQANVGLLSALAGPGDLIVSDQLNHASVIDGCRLSKATVRIADHRSPSSFATKMADRVDFRRCFVVTDSVFSMDGDVAPVAQLRELCDDRQAFLIVDEAHAVGVLGPMGQGICSLHGIHADALVGGLGKGFGSFGGYVAGSQALVEFLLNRARSFVFSTALPPAVVLTSLAAVQILQSAEGELLRGKLQSRIRQLATGLRDMGLLAAGAGESAIFPIVAGDAQDALRWSQELLAQGIFCQAIRPPTVAPGTSRLRLALSALHTHEDIERVLLALRSLR